MQLSVDHGNRGGSREVRRKHVGYRLEKGRNGASLGRDDRMRKTKRGRSVQREGRR